MIAATEGAYRIDIVREALETAFPKFFGHEDLECLTVEQDVYFMLKAIANNEKTNISEILREGLKIAFPQYIPKNV